MSDEKVKLVVPLDDPDGPAAENIWVTHLENNEFRVCNVPTHAYGLSNADTIVAHKADDGRLTFDKVIERGGHSTYRVIPASDIDKNTFAKRWDELENVGCSYESTTGNTRYAIDVASGADIHAVYALLEKGESDGIWEFEEGHCGHEV